MLHLLCQAFHPAAEQAGNLFSFLPHIDGTTLGSGGAAAALTAIWYFARVIRKIIATLFMFCVSYLVLKLGFDIDLAQYIMPLLGK